MDVGIYVHIPFCVSKCYYCDFTSYAHGKSEYETYVDALISEIKAHGKNVQEPLTIKTIFIGGGTPSVLPPILLEKILIALKRGFDIADDVEYSIETNPGTLSLGNLMVMKEHGINRISMGVQAYQNHLLKKIGRIHTRDEFIENYYLCRKLGFDNINLDLMFGLPDQTLDDWKETLKHIVKLQPDHISAYSLIIEEGTPFGDMYDRGELEESDEELERLMYHFAKDYLRQNEYGQYEISNFSKKGKESRHNINCWKALPYIGIGLGAHSYFHGSRYHNTYDMSEYISNSDQLEMIQKDKEYIDINAQMEEYMFLGLRLTKGIELDDFKKRFNKSVLDVYADQINKHKKDKLLIEVQGRIFLTRFGQDVSNIVFSSFLQ